ncbi:MAG: T9SS type A sorting domain-containing protein [Bacteroidales bacterium]
MKKITFCCMISLIGFFIGRAQIAPLSTELYSCSSKFLDENKVQNVSSQEASLPISYSPRDVDLQKLRFGGFSNSTIPGLESYNAFGFQVQNSSQYYLLGESLSKGGSLGLVNSEESLRVQAGAWTGSEWVVYTMIKPKTGSTRIGLYFAIEPISMKIRKIGNGFANTTVTPVDMAYDPVGKNMYAIRKNCLYTMSLQDSTITLVDTLRLINQDKTEIIPEDINVLACNSKGMLYVISTKNEVFKVDKKSGNASLVGSTGTKISTNLAKLQSACFDYRTDRMYWAAYNLKNLYEIDTLTGEASIVCGLNTSTTTGLFVHYYVENCPPGDVEDMQVKVEASNPLKIEITAQAPSLNFNEEIQNSLKQVYLYRAQIQGPWVKVDSLPLYTAGQAIRFTPQEKEQGVYVYGLRVQDQNNLPSLSIVEQRGYAYSLTLPYSNSFEPTDLHAPISIEQDSGWIIVDSNALSGTHAYYNYRQDKSILQINKLPIKKGANYQFSFNARMGSGESTSSLSCSIDHIVKLAKVEKGQDYSNFIADYQGKENGAIDIFFKGYYQRSFFIDDIKFAQISSEKVPDTIRLISCETNDKGELEAEIVYKNPIREASGAPLESIKGVIIESSQSPGFSGIKQLDTLLDRTIGSIDTVKIKLNKEGYWYFRLTAYNSYGLSPYPAITGKTAWIGFDTVPTYPRNSRAKTLSDGRIQLTWDEVTKGKNGGFLNGTITGYRVICTPGQTNIQANQRDTTIVSTNEYTSSVLPAGAYGFKIAAIRNNEYIGIAEIQGAFSSIPNTHIVLNTDRNLNTITLPFCVNATEKQSSITQLSYSVEEMDGARVIDTLIFYTQATIAGSIPLKIYLDYKTDTTCMINNENWTSFRRESSILVFQDTIMFSPDFQKIAIPIKPYFYDGSAAFLMTIIKPMCSNTGRLLCYGTELSENRSVFKFETSTTKNCTDFDTISDVNEINPYKSVGKKIPGLVLSEPHNLSTLKGTVSRKRDQKSIEANIYIKPKEKGKALIDINYNFKNDSITGNFSFSKLVPNTYIVRIGALGYIDTTFEWKVEKAETYICHISLEDAHKIKIKGRVVNLWKEAIAGAEIKLKGSVDYRTTTDTNGVFEIQNIYNKTSYDLSISKFKFQDYHCSISLMDSNQDFGDIALSYKVVPVTFVNANAQKKQVDLSWEKPSIAEKDSTYVGWCNDSCYNSFSAKSLKILGALRLSPQDMINKKVFGKKLKAIRVKLTDYYADYTLRVFQGENAEKEVYSKHLGDKRAGKWYEFTLDKLLSIDYKQDLYIGIEAADGYEEYPIGVDEGPCVDTLKNMVRFRGEWMDIKALNTAFNYNIAIKGMFVEPIESVPPMGYRILRGNAETQDLVNTWPVINSEDINTEKFVDTTWANVPMGYYQYAVIANFGNEHFSEPCFSNVVGKDMKFDLRVKIEEANPRLDSVVVLLRNNNDLFYTQYISSGDSLSFNQILRGEYHLDVRLPYRPSVQHDINLVSDTLLEVAVLPEYISDPYITHHQFMNHKVVINWSVADSNSFTESFEEYPDFAIDHIGPYSLSSPVKKGGIKDVLWENCNVEQSWIVFNPSKTKPSLGKNVNWMSISGNKYLAAMYAASKTNNDQIIFPISSPKLGRFSFLVNGIGFNGTREKMQVLYSLSDRAWEHFIPLAALEEVDFAWVSHSYYLPANTKYVAIRYLSQDVMALLIDELTYSVEGEGKPLSYELYLDGTFIESVDASVHSYTFDIKEGKHTLGVRAKYPLVYSKTAELEIDYVSNADLENRREATIYPNPSFTGIYYVNVPEAMELKIFNINGQLISKQYLDKGEQRVDIKEQSSGIYFFTLSNAHYHQIMKVLR